ncbi:MAG: hypothetical protein K9K66_04280 [Desulfarculaceae bacterium]|nr:hypothetical protein [Desulfarculaceae bacterium]MCF8073260.1 hypothetical protein [Desulfarculaceae bacterium]MCF8100856.1 hypothetical protein [Desulfarculaceae bacterium]
MDLRVLKEVRLVNAGPIREVCHQVATVEQRGDVVARAAALVDVHYSTFYSRLRGHDDSHMRLADVMAIHFASRARRVEQCLIWPALRAVDDMDALEHSGNPLQEMNDVVGRLGSLAQGIAEAMKDGRIDQEERPALERLFKAADKELRELGAVIMGKGGPKGAKK